MHQLLEQSDYFTSAPADTPDPALVGEPANSSDQWALGLEVRVIDFLSGYTLPAVLESFTPGEVTVTLNEPMSEHRLVSVQMNSFVFEGETLFCAPRERGYEAHITINDAGARGMRRSPRFPVNFAGQLFSTQADGVAITIVDISRDGLGLELASAIGVRAAYRDQHRVGIYFCGGTTLPAGASGFVSRRRRDASSFRDAGQTRRRGTFRHRPSAESMGQTLFLKDTAADQSENQL